MAGQAPPEEELRALARRWDGREHELVERARVHGVRNEVSPLGYGHPDREPLLHERLWTPDPREVQVARFRERASEFTRSPTLRFELDHEPFG